ncbi:MAG: hypothetical protein HQ567_07355 [Candidatus Nealsonbacteria bacterium]|nr:hypothetical protein [Candidatus Nealsonbacteria bacterium]
MTNDEEKKAPTDCVIRHSSFVLRHSPSSFVIRASSFLFVIRASSFLLMTGFLGFGICAQAAQVVDVRIGADGLLRGRVLDASGDLRPETAGQTSRVKLIRGRQVVLVLQTDRRGGFAVRDLAGGLYRAVVQSPSGSADRFFRVWTNSAAPPQASNEMVVPLESPIVRGQHFTPLPVGSFPEALVLAEIAGGAAAAPIVYTRARAKNQPNAVAADAEVAASSAAEMVAEAMAAPAVYEMAGSDEKVPRSP